MITIIMYLVNNDFFTIFVASLLHTTKDFDNMDVEMKLLGYKGAGMIRLPTCLTHKKEQ